MNNAYDIFERSSYFKSVLRLKSILLLIWGFFLIFVPPLPTNEWKNEELSSAISLNTCLSFFDLI